MQRTLLLSHDLSGKEPHPICRHIHNRAPSQDKMHNWPIRKPRAPFSCLSNSTDFSRSTGLSRRNWSPSLLLAFFLFSHQDVGRASSYADIPGTPLENRSPNLPFLATPPLCPHPPAQETNSTWSLCRDPYPATQIFIVRRKHSASTLPGEDGYHRAPATPAA